MGNKLIIAGRKEPVTLSDVSINYSKPGAKNVQRDVVCVNNNVSIYDAEEQNPEALFLNSDEAYNFLNKMIGSDGMLSINDFKNFHEAAKGAKIKELNYAEARITLEFNEGDIMTIDFERTRERKKAEIEKKEYEANTTDPVTNAAKRLVDGLASLFNVK